MGGWGIPFDVMCSSLNGRKECRQLKDRAVPFRGKWGGGNSHASSTVMGGHIEGGTVIKEFKDSRGGRRGWCVLIGLHDCENAADLSEGSSKSRIGGISCHVAKGSTVRGTFFAWINGEWCKGVGGWRRERREYINEAKVVCSRGRVSYDGLGSKSER